MKPRIHRYLSDQVRQLAADLRDLPMEVPAGVDQDYLIARTFMIDFISLAMKHEMQANTFLNRSEKYSEDRVHWRKLTAESWWGFRWSVRKAVFFHACARIFLDEATS